MRALSALLRKELLQLRRNPFIPKLILAFPLVIMLIMPLVTTMDVKHINLALVDNDGSTLSRRLTAKLDASEYFTLVAVAHDYPAALALMESGDVDLALEIPRDYEKAAVGGMPKTVNISANGVNSTKGSLGAQYAAQTVMLTLAEWRGEAGLPAAREMFTVENRYNPTLNYRIYMIPALMIMLMIMICGFLPAINLVTEKEVGTIEQINVTPVSRLTFTLAKLLPYWGIGMIVLCEVMLIAWAVYGLTPLGSLGALFGGAILFVLTMSGLGVAIANCSNNMQQTMFVMFFFIIIFVLLSGLMTPIASMPEVAQTLTRLLPARYLVEIMRSVYLKGATVADLWVDYASLAVAALAFNSVAALTYRKQQ